MPLRCPEPLANSTRGLHRKMEFLMLHHGSRRAALKTKTGGLDHLQSRGYLVATKACGKGLLREILRYKEGDADPYFELLKGGLKVTRARH